MDGCDELWVNVRLCFRNGLYELGGEYFWGVICLLMVMWVSRRSIDKLFNMCCGGFLVFFECERI